MFQQHQCGTFAGVFPAHPVGRLKKALQLGRRVVRGNPARLVSQQVLPVLEAHAGHGSLIPSNRTYVQQMRVYEGNTGRSGLHHMHGLRHAFTRDRYQELTGWSCPAAGGPVAKELSP